MNRILRKLHLKRKNYPTDMRKKISKVQHDIQESGGCLEYRSMYHRLILSGYQCNGEKEKKEVAKMLCQDPLMFGCSNDFAELAIVVMKNSGLQMPFGRNGAEELYICLISLIDKIWICCKEFLNR